jgi:hypothetical protein
MNEKKARKAIEQITANEPWLSIDGIHGFEYFEGDIERGRDSFGRETTHKKFLEDLEDRRKGFGGHWEEFAAACDILENMEKTKRFNKKYTSYALKDLFEKGPGHLNNGVFIAAALHAGFQYKAVDKSSNPYLNISNASIKKLQDQISGKN